MPRSWIVESHDREDMEETQMPIDRKWIKMWNSMKCYSATKNEIIPFATTWMDLKVIIVQFSSVTQPCPTLCDPMNRRTPGLPVHHQLPEFAQTHVHWVGDAIQPSHPLSSSSPPTFNLSQHQSFLMSQFFTSGGQSIGVSASTSVLPMNASKWSKSNRVRKIWYNIAHMWNIFKKCKWAY